MQTVSPAELAEATDAQMGKIAWQPRWNISPVSDVLILRSSPHDQCREILSMSWNFQPYPLQSVINNARAETLTVKPTFRDASARRRGLIPLDGWYEWLDGSRPRQPYYHTIAKNQGTIGQGSSSGSVRRLWAGALWVSDRQGRHSCCIITTQATPKVARIHDRMPLLITEDHHDRWLDPAVRAVPDLLATVCDEKVLEITAVSTSVNSTRNQGPQLVEPAQEQLFF